MTSLRLPKIAFTMGDPAGIGPEIIVRMLEAHPEFAEKAELFIYGSPEVIRDAIGRFCKRPLPAFELVEAAGVKVSHLADGVLSPECGLAAYETVVRAAKDAVAGKIDAMVTAPVNKAAVCLNGIPFSGHTELVAEICGTTDFAMMQSAGSLRIVFVTTHIALSEVPAACTFDRIVRTAELLHDAIRAEGIPDPCIAVAAINPHAGENGNMGREDEDTVKPAVRRMNELGIHAEGPVPPDALFVQSVLRKYDGIVSMYHDQGHIPFKMLAFDRGVNSTLGLPIIRTSVDHGTAFNIAGQGIADFGSLAEAFRIALGRAFSRIQNQL
jgi:4-hydroxythreonine-4-phosphate dehydrogenase